MANFTQLAETETDATFKDVYKIIGESQSIHQSRDGMTTDSADYDFIPLSIEDGRAIQEKLFAKVQANMLEHGNVNTLDDVKNNLASGLAKITMDSFYNPVNKIGTTFDPGYYNTSQAPVMMSPQEASSMYGNGGIPGMIIDYKSGAMLTNGYRFIGQGWKPEWCERLKDYADSKQFDKAMLHGNRDGNIFGGALVVPVFKDDSPATYKYSFDKLLEKGIIQKDSLTRFWTADRWNCVLVPDYNMSLQDYLTPKTIFVPITGLTVNTERACIIRPRQLDYWGTIRQTGWGISEFESWITPFLAYKICVNGVPIMAQQQSVMYSHLPMDALLATGGANAVKATAEEIRKQLVQMSNVAPNTFNQALELKTIERNFTGYPELLNILKQDLCAGAELSDSLIFNTQAGGMNTNDDGESQLKMAGAIQKIANRLIPQYQNAVKCLVYSCFGPDSEQAKLADNVRVDFDSPVVLTNEERNQAGTTFATVATGMFNIGLQPADCIEIAKSFIPDVEIPQDVIDKLNAVPEMGETDQEVGAGVESLAQQLGGGNQIAKLAEKLAPKSGVETLADKLEPKSGTESLADKLKGGIKKLFSRISKKD